MKSIVYIFSFVTMLLLSSCASQEVRYENKANRILKKVEREIKKEEERIKRNSVPVVPAQKNTIKKDVQQSAPKILYDK
jgi:hypothetical protein